MQVCVSDRFMRSLPKVMVECVKNKITGKVHNGNAQFQAVSSICMTDHNFNVNENKRFLQN